LSNAGSREGGKVFSETQYADEERPCEEVTPPLGAPSLVSFRLWTSGLLHRRCGGKQAHSFDGIP
jgi:hypothetical protein